ncbi:MAG TPA: peptide chain release factor N(5)-glutamine methyltransferase [Oscillatoriaceae cyanobacterium M33_DOE_052]|uniref:Release factor glutamine methyltransferase n=1 Tax=Planktothricoides sp. SpSt-374 TaxID=2282167 RepID=A0A7C3VVG3_9CYAN|nr:peptide chain release factor N(5)-glutamine methyltransferase [Oscillatoriaceae cyanobacterium M33_DOE_052]
MPVVSGRELWQWRQDAIAAASLAGVPTEEVDWLLMAVAGLDKLALRLNSYQERSHISILLPLAQLSRQWEQRLQDHFPVQYVAGMVGWRQFSLAVNPSVLIPRPETEYLIDLAVGANQEGNWADLGTGSGAIAIGLAAALPSATIHAVDCSPEALATAQANAHRLGFAHRIHFYLGSWCEPLSSLQGQLSGIAANPPYIPSAMVPQLQPEVAKHEPHLALDGGVDGLDCIRQIVRVAPAYLKPGGVLLLEMMAGQASSVTELLHCQGSYRQISIHSDLAGIERFACAIVC